MSICIASRFSRRWLFGFLLLCWQNPSHAQEESVQFHGEARIARDSAELKLVNQLELPRRTKASEILIADLNGDKLDDFLVPAENPGRCALFKSEGLGRYVMERFDSCPPISKYASVSVDRKDGKRQIIVGIDEEGQALLEWDLNSGKPTINSIKLPHRGLWYPFASGDFLGEGRRILMLRDAANSFLYLGGSELQPTDQFRRVKSFTTGRLWTDSSAVRRNDTLKAGLLSRERLGGGVWYAEKEDAPALAVAAFNESLLWGPMQTVDIDGDGNDDVFSVTEDRSMAAAAISSKGETWKVRELGRLFENNDRYLLLNIGGSPAADLIIWRSSENLLEYAEDFSTPGRHAEMLAGADALASTVVGLGSFVQAGRREIVLLHPSETKILLTVPIVEDGLPSVTLAAENGLIIATDDFGRFKIPKNTTIHVLKPVRKGYRFEPVQLGLDSAKPAEALVFHAFYEPHREAKVCVSYDASKGRWGRTDTCPFKFAALEADDGPLPQLTCCELPNEEILSGEVVTAKEQCPADAIVVGAHRQQDCKDCPVEVRCAKLDTQKFRLSAPEPGIYWGDGLSSLAEERRVLKDNVPAALKSAIGRVTLKQWDIDGCLGRNFNRVLVSISGAKCDKMSFSEIIELGGQERPVQLLPECRAITAPFSPYAACLP